jgi:hypothetical protein
MLFKLKLKNSDAAAIIDSEVYEHIEQNEYFQKIDFLGNLRLHSAGYAVFQKSWRTADKSYKVETIYLHKYIAAKFLPKPTGRENDKMSVRLKNDNKLDCRIENLEYATMSRIARKSKAFGITGYRGVYKYPNYYKAMIYIDRKPINLGQFKTADEAAEAYNVKAAELFGKEATLNVVGKPNIAEEKKRKSKANYNDNVKRRSPRRKKMYLTYEEAMELKRLNGIEQ